MKTTSRLATACSLSLIISIPAEASNWNYPFIYSNDELYFFDADSVEKTNDFTAVWIKSVRKEGPDASGTLATAMRWRFNCKKHTLQVLSSSMYGKKGVFINSNNNPSNESLVTPDTIGDGMQKVVCAVNFPNDKSGKFYFKIDNNDVYIATERYMEGMKSLQDDAPK
jgi:hypothetical protein